MHLPAKNNSKDIESTDAALCLLLMEDRSIERSFISVRNSFDILAISLFIMATDVSAGKISDDDKDTESR